jgi:hypothetical protein
MSKLSTAQARTLEAVAAATDANRAWLPPVGPSSRPAKFLKNAELIGPRVGYTGYWITDKGREELAKIKGGAPS